MLRLVRRAPDLAVGLEILAKQMPDLIENGIRLNDDTLKDLASEKRASIMSGRIAQWVIALSLLTIAGSLVVG